MAAPYVKPIVDPALEFAQKHPKVTIVTTATLCSSLLPLAATGEPITVAATGVACTAAALATNTYLFPARNTENRCPMERQATPLPEMVSDGLGKEEPVQREPLLVPRAAEGGTSSNTAQPAERQKSTNSESVPNVDSTRNASLMILEAAASGLAVIDTPSLLSLDILKHGFKEALIKTRREAKLDGTNGKHKVELQDIMNAAAEAIRYGKPKDDKYIYAAQIAQKNLAEFIHTVAPHIDARQTTKAALLEARRAEKSSWGLGCAARAALEDIQQQTQGLPSLEILTQGIKQAFTRTRAEVKRDGNHGRPKVDLCNIASASEIKIFDPNLSCKLPHVVEIAIKNLEELIHTVAPDINAGFTAQVIIVMAGGHEDSHHSMKHAAEAALEDIKQQRLGFRPRLVARGKIVYSSTEETSGSNISRGDHPSHDPEHVTEPDRHPHLGGPRRSFENSSIVSRDRETGFARHSQKESAASERWESIRDTIRNLESAADYPQIRPDFSTLTSGAFIEREHSVRNEEQYRDTGSSINWDAMMGVAERLGVVVRSGIEGTINIRSGNILGAIGNSIDAAKQLQDLANKVIENLPEATPINFVPPPGGYSDGPIYPHTEPKP